MLNKKAEKKQTTLFKNSVKRKKFKLNLWRILKTRKSRAP